MSATRRESSAAAWKGAHLPIIDADGHLVEDLKAIEARLPDIYRTRGSQERLGDFPLFPSVGLQVAQLHQYPDKSLGKVGPEGWLGFMQDVSIEAAVLYPTHGIGIGWVVSPDWAIDVSRAYNDWFTDTYQRVSPRFKGMGLIPMQEPAEAALELRRMVSKLGMMGAMLPSNGLKGHLGGREYWPVYEEADRLGCCLAIHGALHRGLALDDFYPFAGIHALGHPIGLMTAFAGIIFNGVLDRYPNLRIAFLEGGVAWILACLERFDRSWSTHIQIDTRDRFIKLLPGERISDYIRRHVEEGRIYIGCEGEEAMLPVTIEALGTNKPFMFCSDFPHEVNVTSCRHEIEELLENKKLSHEDIQAVLHKNARRFYRLATVS